uniref:DNA-directed RNA polymerase n=2 Tax=Codium fragile TaxID=3133 RepID=A0A6B9P407_CODFR|nr:DNA-directed RNA polymerase [Codium fragile]
MTLFFDRCFEKKRLKQLLLWFYAQQGEYKTIKLLEKLKSVGFKYATQSGLSIGLEDLQVHLNKSEIMRLTDYEMQQMELNQVNANITNFEKLQQMITIWINKSDAIKKKIINNFKISKNLNPLYLMAFSGARGNMSQVQQLVGIRGLMSDPQGNILDFPIRSNFREGLTLTEYIISCYGARKGIVDTALRTATSGYLTRRLVDVAQHVFIERQNCHTCSFIWIETLYYDNQILKKLSSRLIGRALAKNILIKKSKSQFSLNSCITVPIAQKLSSFFTTVPIRSPLSCNSLYSICQFCYGWNLASQKLVSLGEAIGVLAAQSIGEPGTQLTMRTFHTGGVFSGAAIEQIYSPSNGYIFFPTVILGHLIRTSIGQVAFLTKQDSVIILKTNSKKFVFKIPTYSILFIKQNEYVLKEQLIAQLQGSKPILDQPILKEQHTYTDYNGQIFFENITILQKKKLNSIIRQYTQTIGTIWIAKVFYSELLVNHPIRVTNFDLINSSVPLQKFNLIFHNLQLFLQKKFLFFDQNKQNKNKIQFIDFKNHLYYKNIFFKNTCYFFIYSKNHNPFLNLQFFSFFDGFSNINLNNVHSAYLKIFFKNSRTQNQSLSIIQISQTFFQKKQIKIKFLTHCYWQHFFSKKRQFCLKATQQFETYFFMNCFYTIPIKWLQFTFKKFYFKQYKYTFNSKLYLQSKISLVYFKYVKIHKIQTNTKIGKYVKIRYKISKSKLLNQISTKFKYKKIHIYTWYTFCNTQNKISIVNSNYIFRHINTHKCIKLYYHKCIKFYSNKYIYRNSKNRFYIQKQPINRILKFQFQKHIIQNIQPKYIWKSVQKNYLKKRPLHFQTDSQNLKISCLRSLYSFFESYLITKQREPGEFLILNTFKKWSSKFNFWLYSPSLLWDAQIINIPNFQSKQISKNCFLKIIKKIKIGEIFKITLIYALSIQTSEFLFKNENNSIAFLNLENFETFKNTDSSNFLGQFLQFTQKYFQSNLNQTGIIYALTNKNVILRKAEPKLLSANGIVHVQHRTFVKRNTHFYTMFYTYYQTGDIVQGIPKIEDFFEARHEFHNNPFFTDLQTRLIFLYNKYRIQFIHAKAVRKAILKIQKIIVEEVQTIYTLQGISISDKHIEIIVRQMTSKVRITSGGSSGLLIGEIVDLLWIEKINRDLYANQVHYDPLILGITKTCLETSSFISAASFQETIRVLTQSAVQNKLDFICGLKENVILGHLIPAGTGFFSF